MSFLATKTNPNGSVSQAHKVNEIKIVGASVVVTVNSYATAEEIKKQYPQPNWQDRYTDMPLSNVSDAEGWLISGAGPFAGGTLLAESTDLDAQKANKTAEINDKRNQLEQGGFPYLGKTFDSDSTSVQRIYGAVFAAQQALAAGVEYAVEWTTADNSIIELDAEQVIGLPVALATFVAALHLRATALKALIEAAKDEAALAVINWFTSLNGEGTSPAPTASPAPEVTPAPVAAEPEPAEAE